MKKLLGIPLVVCTLSYIANLVSWFSGGCTLLYDRISLISSTIAWFSLLLTLYFIAEKNCKRNTLVKINIVLLLTIALPLYNIFSTTSQSIATASTGLLAAVFEFLNYAWRILLAFIGVSVLMKKPVMFRISLISLSALVFNSFCFRVGELYQMISQVEKPSCLDQFAKILDPIGILLFFILIIYVVSNKNNISNVLTKVFITSALLLLFVFEAPLAYAAKGDVKIDNNGPGINLYSRFPVTVNETSATAIIASASGGYYKSRIFSVQNKTLNEIKKVIIQ